MRRRAGADSIDIDTQAGTVVYTLDTPRRIDFGDIEGAAYDAGYTLREVRLELDAEIVIDEAGAWVRVPSTGQRFELLGQHQETGRFRITAEATGWKEGRVRLNVVGHAAASP